MAPDYVIAQQKIWRILCIILCKCKLITSSRFIWPKYWC